MSFLPVLLWCAVGSMIAAGLAVIGIVLAMGARDRGRGLEAELAALRDELADDNDIVAAAEPPAINGHPLPGMGRWPLRGDIGPPA